MKLNSIDWSRAQELLLKLVQVLGPFTGKGDNGPKTPLPVPKNFFAPPSAERPFQHQAQLLTALHKAQGEVEEWIGSLPENGAENPSVNPSEQPSDSYKQAAAPRRREFSSSPQKEGSKKGDAVLTKTEAARFFESKPGAQKPLPVENQAQKILEQVRQAIYSLSSSSNLLDPKAGPLRDAFKRLKPLIDQFIEAVSHEGMHTAGEDLPYLFRFKIAPSERETLFRKRIPFPMSRPSRGSSRSFASAQQEVLPLTRDQNKNKARDPIGSDSKRDTGEAGRERRSVFSSQRLPSQMSAFDQKVERASPELLPDLLSSRFRAPPLSTQGEGMHQAAEKEEGAGELPPIERTTIPGAPFIASSRSESTTRKKRKKQKNFWLREEEEEPPK